MTSDNLYRIAALLEDRDYMGQCDGISSLLKTGREAAAAIRDLQAALTAARRAEDKAFNEALEKAIGIARRCGAFATARDIRKLIRTVEE